MPKLPRINGKELIKALSKIGIVPVRQRGSHVQMEGFFKGKLRHTTVYYHSKEKLPLGTLKGILEDCELTVEELIELL